MTAPLTLVRFDGDPATIVRMASADENARTPLRIRVWRRSIVGAELGGSWHWAQGNPPGNTIPAVFLAVSFALLLLVVRLPIHRRAGSGANRQRLLADDVGQVAAAAGSFVLLAYGFWPGAILAPGGAAMAGPVGQAKHAAQARAASCSALILTPREERGSAGHDQETARLTTPPATTHSLPLQPRRPLAGQPRHARGRAHHLRHHPAG